MPVVRAAHVDVLVPTAGRPSTVAACLTALALQTEVPGRLVVSDQTRPGDESPLDDPAVGAALRLLSRRGCAVVTGTHLPRRGLAEHRQHLLDRADAPYVLYLDSDVVLEPEVLARLRAAMGRERCGFVAAAMQGASFLDDERPREQESFELWDGPVRPERVRKGDPAWERWRLHNAANLTHVADRLAADGALGPDGWAVYHLAWAAGCVLFDRAALVRAGGFSWWPRLPAGHRGEDVVAQLRVLEAAGGCGVVPSGAWHVEAPTSITDRSADAYALVLEADDRAVSPAGPPRRPPAPAPTP